MRAIALAHGTERTRSQPGVAAHAATLPHRQTLFLKLKMPVS